MGRKKKKRIAVIDAETDPFEYNKVPKPFAWGFFDGEDYAQFWGDDCTEQLLEYLQDEEDLIIYAHNGGKFDFFYLLESLDQNLLLINGRIAKASIHDERIELRDSYLILPMPLSAHDKDSIDYEFFKREHREKHKAEILKYLRKDCTSLHEWVEQFRNQFGNGLTIAGTAFNQLKQTDYKVTNTFDDFDSKFRQFYYGGRVQCFGVGEYTDRRELVDINSAYPFAMMQRHWQGSRYVEVLKVPAGDLNGSWFIECDAISKGALPFKGPDKKLYFPDDNKVRRYRVTGWEIIAGIKTDTLTVKKVHRVYKPVHTQDFSDYVNKFFAMKHEADVELKKAKISGDQALIRYWSTQRLFAKLMLNSCYGKFGQDGRKFKKHKITEFGEFPDDDLDWTPAGEHFGEYAYMIFSRPDPVDRFYNVATAASVTGFVRAYLWENICASDGVLYCDTDSILCKKFGGKIGPELGEWELEASVMSAYIAKRKMYALDCYSKNWPFSKKKVASKGVKLTYNQIKDGILTGKSVISKFEAPAFSLKDGVRFTKRITNFDNLELNALNNPPE